MASDTSTSGASHLVIGASGQVGEHLLRALAERGLDAVGTYRSCEVAGMERLDVRDEQGVRALIRKLQPGVVHVPASLSHVDWCEEHPRESYAINVLGVSHVVGAARDSGARVVYFSSDYVFDGESGPYDEEAPANPLSEYGRQKLAAEHLVALRAPGSLIVRTTVVYGPERQGKNFIQRLRSTLEAGQVLRVPADQVGSPTFGPDLARAVVDLAQSDAHGAFHVAGSELADRFEFAREAARAFELDESLIVPVSTRELGQAAARPLRAGMLCEKAAAKLGRPLLGFREGLRLMAASAARETMGAAAN